MVSLWHIVLISVGLACQPGAAPPTERPATPPAPTEAERKVWLSRLEAADAAMAKVVDLRADFEQRRHTSLLKRPLVSKGVVLTKGERVRWDTATPRLSSLVIGGGEIRMYYPADKLVEVYPVGEGFKDLAGAPLPRMSVMQERFDISPLAASEMGAVGADSAVMAVLLAPKSTELQRHIRSVKVLLNTVSGVATRVVITDPEGEETEILFSNIRLNSGVKDTEVQLNLPDDVRVSRPLGPNKNAAPGGGKSTVPEATAQESKP